METFGFGNDFLGSNEKLDIKVEQATVEDAEGYRKIRLEAIDNDPSAFGIDNEERSEKERNRDISEWRNDLLDKNFIIVLAKHNSEVVGMVKGTKEEKGICWLRSVYLNPDFRKSKIGGNISEEIVKKVLDLIKERRKGKEIKVRLGVEKMRETAIKLYAKFGFKRADPKIEKKIVGNDPVRIERWQVMELDLVESKDN